MAKPHNRKAAAVPEKSERKYIAPEKVGLKIKSMMADLGLSQYKLAQAMGLQVGHIWKLFSEENPNPTLAMLERVARGLSELTGKKVKIRDLIDE